MRQNCLIQLTQHTQRVRHSTLNHMPIRFTCNMLKFPQVFNKTHTNSSNKHEHEFPMHISYTDFAVSLFWSQHRPLTLFHNFQNLKKNDISNTHNIFKRVLYSIFPTDSCSMQYTNYSLGIQKKSASPLNFLNIQPVLHALSCPKDGFTHFFQIRDTNVLFTPYSSNICVEKYATSVKRKRKLKMNKHKFEKRRDKQRALRRRIGK
ncbi:hypothetical protein PORY_000018 [Pneumocystis oryctolagi]|uniref:Uncharacterized protein n=1 Tax=Pneumocystis oryctolagi TaxID=42067 RepID=A0ACB7CF76_9ASCO|nr:hypothetical protein PORY_000018 [Pneumocystis oryctolagi]